MTSTWGKSIARGPGVILLAVLTSGLMLAGCDSSTASTPGNANSASACVSDPAKVTTTPEAAASTTSALPATLVSKLNAAAQSSFKNVAAPGAIVGVRTPKGTWTNTYGYADHATKAPMTTDMHMRIGSVTKTLTGTLILQLAQQGKLQMTDTIDKYVPGIPNGNKITLEQLANMTSGVASYSFTKPWAAKYFGDPSTVFTPDQLIAYAVPASPMFAPGAKFFYSNTNAILLGKVIEKVTGQPYADVLQKRIFTPLGLTNTSAPGDEAAIPDPHPQGYTLLGNHGTPSEPANATYWNPSFGWSAGELISTLSDMLTYDRALGTGQGLLSTTMATKRLESFPKPPKVAYGEAIGCIDGWVGHTGELPGFNTSVFYDTTSDTSVVVLVNSDIASGKCTESPTLTGNPTEVPCAAPATRIFASLSKVLGNEFHPNPLN